MQFRHLMLNGGAQHTAFFDYLRNHRQGLILKE
jgi:hypothetical protein